MSVALAGCRIAVGPFPGFSSTCLLMEDIVDLGENSQRASIRVPVEVDGEFGSQYADDQPPVPHPVAASRESLHGGRASGTSRASSAHLNRWMHFLTKSGGLIGPRRRC